MGNRVATKIPSFILFENASEINPTNADGYYLLGTVFGVTGTTYVGTIINCLTYWTIISIVYLIFDVLMYVPLLAHRWIDKARLE